MFGFEEDRPEFATWHRPGSATALPRYAVTGLPERARWTVGAEKRQANGFFGTVFRATRAIEVVERCLRETRAGNVDLDAGRLQGESEGERHRVSRGLRRRIIAEHLAMIIAWI